MVFYGIVAPYSVVSFMKGNTLVIIIHFDRGCGIVDKGGFTDIPVRNAVVTFLGRKKHIANLLNFCPAVIFHLVSSVREWLQVTAFNRLKKFSSAGLLSLKQKVVIAF